MEDKSFIWSSDLTKRLFELRFEHDWLFKKLKQPWREFRRILLENGFPKEMTVSHVRKKWSYTYDTYRVAKKTKNKSWKYYKIFDRYFGKTILLDKYESWSDEWRLKLITCITETKSVKMEYNDMWGAIEQAMRCQDLPLECCVQDMEGLWQHIRTTFNRKHRLQLKKGSQPCDWPLYDAMLEYYEKYEPQHLVKLATDSQVDYASRQRKASKLYGIKNGYWNNDNEFHWTKDITETFIQIRLQNDWLFKERKWAWNDLLAIMVDEYGFPKTLSGREICKKWASTYSEYQKAKATNNKSWVYYTLFELYLGEGNLSLNPLIAWQEEWIQNLISARIDLEHCFRVSYREQRHGWREVEKRLRSIGVPVNHSLMKLPDLWRHLVKTFKWKKKFAQQGILQEKWPHYEAMEHFEKNYVPIVYHKKQKQDETEQDYEPIMYEEHLNEDLEDDMKLFDLKQKLEVQVKPKVEYLDAKQCRACAGDDACVDIFEPAADGLQLADKLKIITSVEVDRADQLPSQICLNCMNELENAFKFRRKCQKVDKEYRKNTSQKKIKIEIPELHSGNDTKDESDKIELDLDAHFDTDFQNDSDAKQDTNTIKMENPKRVVIRKKKKIKKSSYDYSKICEFCGKHTRNLASHLDMHANDKAYSCDVCDKKFKFKSGLLIHKAVHDPTPKKKCEVCGKTFHIMAQYRRHFVYHANERKFSCETCGKRFNTVDILKVHIRTHTDERPFTCSECGKTFRTAGCVSRHKRIVHRTTKTQ